MAFAIPEQATKNITIIGSGLASGMVEAVAYRANPTLGTIVTFGGGLAGLGMALLGRGLWADVGTGVAASSAGSLGHFAIRALWPARKALGGGNSRTPLGANPRELVGSRGNPGNPGEVMNEEILV